MNNSTNKTLLIAASVLLPASILGWLVHDSYEGLIGVIHNVNVFYLMLACCSSLITYIFMGLSLWEVLRIMDYKLGLGPTMGIAFVSTTFNYVVSSMGVSGFALRAHLLQRRKVPFGASVTASVVISVLLYMILALLVFQGSFVLVLHSQGTKMQVLEGFVGVGVLSIVCCMVVAAFFNHEFRVKWVRMAFRALNHVIYSISGSLIPHEDFRKFETQLETGIGIIREKKHKLTLAIAYICGDWLFTIMILDMAFRAVGVHIGLGPLIGGFAVGMVATLIPILPGGLGAMELTMTAAYSSLGVPWENALLVTFIYRLVYYLVPGLVSVFVYWGLKLSEPETLAEELSREEKEIDDL